MQEIARSRPEFRRIRQLFERYALATPPAARVPAAVDVGACAKQCSGALGMEAGEAACNGSFQLQTDGEFLRLQVCSLTLALACVHNKM